MLLRSVLLLGHDVGSCYEPVFSDRRDDDIFSRDQSYEFFAFDDRYSSKRFVDEALAGVSEIVVGSECYDVGGNEFFYSFVLQFCRRACY